jgi:transcriptional regulator
MYKMPEFTETDEDAVKAFMRAHPFVMLAGYDGTHPVATQVPVLIDERDGKMILRGHIMRKTDHHLAFEKHPEALVLFTGPHCYVSASWYTTRGSGSTWNYMTVHARGQMRFMDDAFTLQLLTDLTHKYEGPQAHPELLENMSMTGYVQPMMKAIAGFEIVVESIYPIFKLSQNRNDESHANIVQQLLATDDCDSHKIAKEMKKRRV